MICRRAMKEKGHIFMKEKLIRFMQGRYGVDSFSKFLLAAALFVVLISSFFGQKQVGTVLYTLGVAAFVYSYFRIFSRNISKRYAENQQFLMKTAKVRSFFAQQKSLMQQRRTHHIYSCPGCKQKIRIPRGKGKIEIRCPKCGTTFVKKS